MTSERLRQIEELYHSARAACEGDEELRLEAESLLRQTGSAGPLERPAMEVAASTSETTRLAVGGQLGPYQILAPIGKAASPHIRVGPNPDHTYCAKSMPITREGLSDGGC